MNKFFFLLLIFGIGCTSPESSSTFRKNFTKDEQQILALARTIIKDTYFTTFITLDAHNQPRARVMEPFAPDEEFIIWLATNPRSRKVTQLQANPTVTLHYFDKGNLGYVSLMGKASLVNDDQIKASKWKDGWENFYPNKKKDYLLIKFVPESLELISIPQKYTGDSITWKPHHVDLRQ